MFGKRDVATPEEAEGLLHGQRDRSKRDNRPSAFRMLIRALKVGHDRWRTIGISYIGGFIARYVRSRLFCHTSHSVTILIQASMSH